MALLLAIVGALLFFAGLDLLWQARRELAFWMSSYMRMFRSLLREPNSNVRPFSEKEAMVKPRGTLPMFLGMGLAFVGPLLIVLSLTLMLYPKL